MLMKITSKRQVTFPKHVLEELGVGPGDQLELEAGEDGYLLRPRRIKLEKLGTLKVPPGVPPLDIAEFREQVYDPALGD